MRRRRRRWHYVRPTRAQRIASEAWALAYALRDWFGNVEDAHAYAWARASPVWGVGDEWVRLEWARVTTRLRWLHDEAETDKRAEAQRRTGRGPPLKLGGRYAR